MKFSTLALSAASLSTAAPATGAHVVQLEARHAQLLEARQDPVSTIIEMATGIFIFITGEAIGGDVAADFANALAAAFNPAGGANLIRLLNMYHLHLLMSTMQQQGCYVQTTPTESSGATATDANTHATDWNLQHPKFTATDRYAWGGINGTTTCVAQGLCNPQLVFYRTGYTLVIDTWLAHDDTYGGYSDQYAGLCQQGDDEVEDQFSSGGDVLGDTCAIPCQNQANLPDPHSD